MIDVVEQAGQEDQVVQSIKDSAIIDGLAFLVVFFFFLFLFIFFFRGQFDGQMI